MCAPRRQGSATRYRGPATVLFRSGSHVRRPLIQRPRKFSSPVLKVCCAAPSSHALNSAQIRCPVLRVKLRYRPIADFDHPHRMLRCGPSKRPLVQIAAFCWLKRRSAGRSCRALQVLQCLVWRTVQKTVVFGAHVAELDLLFVQGINLAGPSLL